LTQAGVAREQAYEWVQRNAMRAWDEGTDFRALVAADASINAHLSREEIERAFALDTYLRNVDAVFARVFNQVPSPKSQV
jgi:adenylosuccinate lyase